MLGRRRECMENVPADEEHLVKAEFLMQTLSGWRYSKGQNVQPTLGKKLQFGLFVIHAGRFEGVGKFECILPQQLGPKQGGGRCCRDGRAPDQLNSRFKRV